MIRHPEWPGKLRVGMQCCTFESPCLRRNTQLSMKHISTLRSSACVKMWPKSTLVWPSSFRTSVATLEVQHSPKQSTCLRGSCRRWQRSRLRKGSRPSPHRPQQRMAWPSHRPRHLQQLQVTIHPPGEGLQKGKARSSSKPFIGDVHPASFCRLASLDEAFVCPDDAHTSKLSSEISSMVSHDLGPLHVMGLSCCSACSTLSLHEQQFFSSARHLSDGTSNNPVSLNKKSSGMPHVARCCKSQAIWPCRVLPACA